MQNSSDIWAYVPTVGGSAAVTVVAPGPHLQPPPTYTRLFLCNFSATFRGAQALFGDNGTMEFDTSNKLLIQSNYENHWSLFTNYCAIPITFSYILANYLVNIGIGLVVLHVIKLSVSPPDPVTPYFGVIYTFKSSKLQASQKRKF